MRRFPFFLLALVLIVGYFMMSTPQGFSAPTAAPATTPSTAPKAAPKVAPPSVSPKEKAPPAVDPVAIYKKSCGECHMAFPPDFLPSGSWEKLTGSPEKHFENVLEIDKKTLAVITPYLKKNGAEFSKAKIPQKIVQSLEAGIPLRITEVPYIVKKHRKIKPEDFKRKPIGSFSNCGACHLLADEWIFSRKIVIPEYEGTPQIN